MYSSSANLYVLQVDLILDAQPSTHTSTSQEWHFSHPAQDGLQNIHTDTAFPFHSTSRVTNPILLINSLVSQLYEGLMMVY